MKMFYSDVYIHHSKSDGAKKLGDCACLVKFVGYPDGVNGYKFYDPSTCTITLSCSAHILKTITHAPADTFDDDEISVTSDSDHHNHHNHVPTPTMTVPTSPTCTPSPPPPNPLDINTIDSTTSQLHNCS